jgi:hypothetical protein
MKRIDSDFFEDEVCAPRVCLALPVPQVMLTDAGGELPRV